MHLRNRNSEYVKMPAFNSKYLKHKTMVSIVLKARKSHGNGSTAGTGAIDDVIIINNKHGKEPQD